MIIYLKFKICNYKHKLYYYLDSGLFRLFNSLKVNFYFLHTFFLYNIY